MLGRARHHGLGRCATWSRGSSAPTPADDRTGADRPARSIAQRPFPDHPVSSRIAARRGGEQALSPSTARRRSWAHAAWRASAASRAGSSTECAPIASRPARRQTNPSLPPAIAGSASRTQQSTSLQARQRRRQRRRRHAEMPRQPAAGLVPSGSSTWASMAAVALGQAGRRGGASAMLDMAGEIDLRIGSGAHSKTSWSIGRLCGGGSFVKTKNPYCERFALSIYPISMIVCVCNAIREARCANRRRHEGRPKVIELLNEALKNELTATNQYWLHYRLLDNWGVHKLAEFERSESIDEMKHADRLAERILFLDGLPNFQALGRLHIGENVEEILRAISSSSWRRSGQLKGAIAHCERSAISSAATCSPTSSTMRKSMSTRSSSSSR
jgi:bacterioferritin